MTRRLDSNRVSQPSSKYSKKAKGKKRTGPHISLGGDVLGRCACRSDTVDGGLVQVEDEGLVHIMVFVISVEDNEFVALILCCDILPPCLETCSIGDDVLIEPTIVVWLNHGVCTFTGDVVDSLKCCVSHCSSIR